MVLVVLYAEPFELVAVTVALMNLPLSAFTSLYVLALLPAITVHLAEARGLAFVVTVPLTVQRYQEYL